MKRISRPGLEHLEQRRLLNAGDLDVSFAGGVVYGGASSAANDVAVQADGKILVALAQFSPLNKGLTVARYNVNGALDPSFGIAGFATVSFGARSGHATSLALQSDGKIVVGGLESSIDDDGYTISDPVVVRLTSTGKLDTTFSGDGKIEFTSGSPDYSIFEELAIARDDKILFSLYDRQGNATLVRLTPGGAFDSTFDGDGQRLFPGSGGAKLAFAPDDKILIFFNYAYTLRRLLDNGSTDPTFNGGRPKHVTFSVADVLPAAQNRILLLGRGESGLAFRRHRSDGGLDSSFGVAGQKQYGFGTTWNSEMAYAPDGKILVAISTGNNGATLARFTPDANLDTSFGNAGLATVALEWPASTDQIALAPGGKAVIGGYIAIDDGHVVIDQRAVLARFLTESQVPGPGDVFIKDGVLMINGTGSADVITVDPATSGYVLVTLNSTSKTFSLASFSSILVNAYSGNDNVTVSGAIRKPARLLGDEGGDSLMGGGGDDTLEGGIGADTMKGRAGNDTVDYSFRTANLTIGIGNLADDGEAGEKDNVYFDIETVIGGSGNDSIRGHANNNLLLGGEGNDSLYGNYGNDSLNGGDGNDTLDGGKDADAMKGGAGNDVADYSSRTANLIIGLGTLADDGEAGEKDNVYLDVEKVIGGSGNDSIRGHANNNVLLGGAGNDSLYGNHGNDNLFGGSGDDLLIGEAGFDYLDGQTGFDRATNDGFDTLFNIEAPQ